MFVSMYERETDIILLSGRIRICAALHGDHARVVRMIVKFGFDVVTGPALSVTIFLRWVFRIRVAALNHESFDDPMENSAVVEALARQLLEILDGVWRSISPKPHYHFAFAGLNHCHFI